MIFENFPYTNFHELNLDWLLQTCKQLAEEMATLRGDWSDFKAYVENYFKNLDLDDEIKAAIKYQVDQMAADGTLDRIVTSVVARELPEYSAPVFVGSTEAMTDSKKIYVLTSSGHIYAYGVGGFYDTGLAYNIDASTWYQNNGVLATGADLDDLTDANGYYYLNSTATYYHMPDNVAAGLLFVTRTGTVATQVLTGVSFNQLTRHRTGSGPWTAWTQTGAGNNGLLADNTDLDNVTGPGYYLISSTYTYTHGPDWFNGLGGIFVVYQAGAYIMQQFYTSRGRTAVRARAAGTWTAWLAMDGNNGMLPAGSDINDVHEDGFWFINGAAGVNYQNMPADIPSGSAAFLTIRRYNTIVQQVMIKYSDGLIAIRSSNTTGQTWRDWRTVAGKEAESGGLANKKYIAFGDSITWSSVWANGTISQAKYDDRIPTRVGAAVGVSDVVNQGIGDIGYIAKKDGETIEDVIRRTDITDAALITLAGGRNDGNYQLSAIMTALQACITYIKSVNKTCQIVIVQPTPHNKTDGEIAFTEQTAGGWSLDSFELAAKQLAESTGCAYVGWRECSYVWSWASFTGDQNNYAHPNASWLYGQLGAYLGGQVSKFFKM